MSKITEIMALARFPAEACECFEKAYAHIASDSSLFAKLCDLEKTYLAGEATGDARTALSKASDVHIHTIEMLLLLSSATTLRDIYREKGYSEELFLGVLTDLRCKLTECKNVHGSCRPIRKYLYVGGIVTDFGHNTSCCVIRLLLCPWFCREARCNRPLWRWAG